MWTYCFCIEVFLVKNNRILDIMNYMLAYINWETVKYKVNIMHKGGIFTQTETVTIGFCTLFVDSITSTYSYMAFSHVKL